MCDSLIKYEKINNVNENEEVNQLFNLLPILNSNSKVLLNLNFDIDNDSSYQDLFEKYGFTLMIYYLNWKYSNKIR